MASYNFDCCRNCKDRIVGCHAICGAYLAAKDKYNKVKDKELSERRKVGAANKVRNEGINRFKTSRNTNGLMKSHKR